MIIIKCSSCGFIFYKGNQLKNIYQILAEWGFRCPCCMSPLDPDKIQDYQIRISSNEIEKRVRNLVNKLKIANQEITCSICGKSISKGEVHYQVPGKAVCLDCLKELEPFVVIEKALEIFKKSPR